MALLFTIKIVEDCSDMFDIAIKFPSSWNNVTFSDFIATDLPQSGH
jgi:hypothetical protein